MVCCLLWTCCITGNHLARHAYVSSPFTSLTQDNHPCLIGFSWETLTSQPMIPGSHRKGPVISHRIMFLYLAACAGNGYFNQARVAALMPVSLSDAGESIHTFHSYLMSLLSHLRSSSTYQLPLRGKTAASCQTEIVLAMLSQKHKIPGRTETPLRWTFLQS